MKRKILFTFKKGLGQYLLIVLVALMCSSIEAQAQELTVKGTVTSSEDGLPLPGVSIVIKGTIEGTITDFEGKYALKNAKVGDVLTYSFIGMEKQEIKVSTSVINLALNPQTIGLNEVVAIGYGTSKKKELTGAVVQVRAEELNRTVTSDLGTALQGQIAGVSVIASSGAPGASSNIQIRGVTSISGTNTPLFVVDGIPQDGDPRISSNEIETIDVLKDAASCAIYGTRGAAGVILITTKQGKAGSLKISANATYGIRTITSGTPLMNANEQAYFEKVQYRNIYNSYDDEITTGYAKNPYSLLNDTDLGDMVFTDNAPTQDYSVNISGGTNDITYNVVAGYYNQEGVIINSEFERFNTRASTNYTKGKWNVRANVGLTIEDKQESPGGIYTQTIKYYPYQQALDPNSDEAVESNGWGSDALAMNWVLNSIKNKDNQKRDRMNAGFNVNFEIVKGLNFNTNLGIAVTNQTRKIFNPYSAHYASDGEELSNPKDSYVQNQSNRRSSLSWDGGLTYEKEFNDHKITATAIYSFEEYKYSGFTAKKYAVANNSIEVLNGATVDPDAQSLFETDNVLVGAIGRLKYDYKSRYLFSASIRRDGSSRFGKDNRWGVFPSASAAWNVADEAFWAPISEVANAFKIRGSYGTTGNQSFNDYMFASTITQGIDYTFGGAGTDAPMVGAAQKSYANALVKWETSIQSNIGIDLGFFKNKLTFTADYYNTDKEDMLFNVQLPGSAGIGSGGDSRVTLNVGDMTNTGYELALNYRNKLNQFNYGIQATFATNENKITSMTSEGFSYTDDWGLIDGDGTSKITVLAEGYEAGAFFLRKTNGIVNSQAKLDEYKTLDPTAKMGDLIYVDSNMDGVLSDADRTYHGSGLPDYELGLNLNCDYKGFDLSMQWYAAVGHEIINGSKATAYSYARHKDLVSVWSEANPTSTLPSYRGISKDHPNYAGYSDLWIEDGSYLRLRNVSLGYTFPTKIVDKIGVRNMRVYVSAQNPITITSYDGFDPEVGGNGMSSRGLDKGNYPVTSFYLMGVNINF
ncbi:hypothetical protein BZG02_15660 [Labilibaculum filiforme]|uniref:TonB-dependent receptor plug domain-containing protein n=1 Tax=Labilibaculum filiforme TaxID=1940526 RepID=A0A2N3HTT9_9BACT|nr:TonB-dependent receptor [Labilibaculum filiforme]PKQ61459.1 hypothetical protein BZG02_15660 [Labilibaculum filiforme]